MKNMTIEYKCTLCRKKFTHLKFLKWHIRYVHKYKIPLVNSNDKRND